MATGETIMNWRETVDGWAGRLNPYLARLAVGLAMMVVLMAYGERQGGARQASPGLHHSLPSSEDGAAPWRTD